MTAMRRVKCALAGTLGLACLGMGGMTPTSAVAAFEISAFSGGVVNSDGTSAEQAGAHPYSITTEVQFPAVGFFEPDGQVKEVQVDLPPGLIGNPTVVPAQCTMEQLLDTRVGNGGSCPVSAQLGTATIWLAGLPFPFGTTAVYNMEPPPGHPAAFAFRIAGQPAMLFPSVRTGSDYGITVRSPEISQVLPVNGVSVTLWGTPADPSHDADRGTPVDAGLSVSDQYCAGTTDPECSNRAGYSPAAFLTNRMDCAAGALPTAVRAWSWQQPGFMHTASFDHDINGQPTVVTGCDKVPFDPSFEARPTSTAPDSPTGMEVSISLPQEGLETPGEQAQSTLKKAVVTLPEGMTVNPSSADRLGACLPTQIALSGPTAASTVACPDDSKVGTVAIDTPLLEEPLEGAVYVAKQNDNPFKSLLALYIVARGPGVVVKLPGRIDLDQRTGRLTATFDNNPQLPFRSLSVKFFHGPRAPLATPIECGPKDISAELTPWSGGAPVTLSSSFDVPCPGGTGFAPSLAAGLVNPTAGRFSPFVLRVDRPDRQEYLDGLTATLPPGLLAKIKNVPLCSSSSAAAGACPEASQIGTVTVGAGPGSNPFFLGGKISLTEGYKGAPYGLVIAVRAIAGPFDLGTVIVRQAVFVDPKDAHLTVVSDSIPTILEGIPLRLRTIQVDVNRKDFTVAPTSCGQERVGTLMHSQQGSSAAVSVRFQVGDCQALSFAPRMRLTLTGRKQVKVGRHPGLTARVTQRSGAANLGRVTVRLPLSLALDPNNARGLCEYEDGLRAKCPQASIIGKARAVSPLLPKSLVGPVYFVKGVRFGKNGRRIRTLPTLLVTLRGDISIDLRGSTSISKNRLVSTFPAVPDAPISSFDLALNGGRHGILTVTGRRSLCSGKQVAAFESDAQSGKRSDSSVTMKTPCAKR